MECIKNSSAMPGCGNARSRAHAVEPPNGKGIFESLCSEGKLLMPRRDMGWAFRIYPHRASELAFQSHPFPVKMGIYSTGGFLLSPAIANRRRRSQWALQWRQAVKMLPRSCRVRNTPLLPQRILQPYSASYA